MRKQAKMSDHCPKCGSKQSDVRKCDSETLVIYECGSSRIKNGNYIMRSDKCENACLGAQLEFVEESLKLAEDTMVRVFKGRDELRKKLAETEEELDTAQNLLADILPLAMNANLDWDWGPIVDRICKALGREVPETEASQDANCATRRE